MIIFGAEIAEVSHAFGSLANVKKTSAQMIPNIYAQHVLQDDKKFNF